MPPPKKTVVTLLKSSGLGLIPKGTFDYHPVILPPLLGSQHLPAQGTLSGFTSNFPLSTVMDDDRCLGSRLCQV